LEGLAEQAEDRVSRSHSQVNTAELAHQGIAACAMTRKLEKQKGATIDLRSSSAWYPESWGLDLIPLPLKNPKLLQSCLAVGGVNSSCSNMGPLTLYTDISSSVCQRQGSCRKIGIK
jgi:hypothetical protein